MIATSPIDALDGRVPPRRWLLRNRHEPNLAICATGSTRLQPVKAGKAGASHRDSHRPPVVARREHVVEHETAGQLDGRLGINVGCRRGALTSIHVQPNPSEASRRGETPPRAPCARLRCHRG